MKREQYFLDKISSSYDRGIIKQFKKLKTQTEKKSLIKDVKDMMNHQKKRDDAYSQACFHNLKNTLKKMK